jgi:hypothetical protein
MTNITEKYKSSIVEINERNELVINNKKKTLYKTNEKKNKINDSLQFEKTIKDFFLSNQVDGSTINILIG